MKLTLGQLRRLIREAAKGKGSAQADPDDPFGQYLFAPHRSDLPAAARREEDTPEEEELFQAFADHYNNEEYTLGGFAPELLKLVKQGKYTKLLAPPGGPYYRIITNITKPVLAGMLGVKPGQLRVGEPTAAGGGVMKPGGDMAGSTGIHSWTTDNSVEPEWFGDIMGGAYHLSLIHI